MNNLLFKSLIYDRIYPPVSRFRNVVFFDLTKHCSTRRTGLFPKILLYLEFHKSRTTLRYHVAHNVLINRIWEFFILTTTIFLTEI